MRRLSLRGQIPGFWKVVLMGDYKMSQVEQVERDRSRAREDNSYWVQRPEVDRLVAAAVEERDSEWRERIESGRPLIFNHRGADTPAVTTGSGVNTNNEEDENLG